jgi:Flp pilus assembly CpaF family ATPase
MTGQDRTGLRKEDLYIVKQRAGYVTITSLSGLELAESKYRDYNRRKNEIVPFAKNTPYRQLAENVVPDRTSSADNAAPHPFCIIESTHNVALGLHPLLVKVNEYLSVQQGTYDFDILSVCGNMEKRSLTIVSLIRIYESDYQTSVQAIIDGLYTFLGEKIRTGTVPEPVRRKKTGLNRDSVPEFSYTQEEIDDHARRVAAQQAAFNEASEDKPFLNMIDSYTPAELPKYDESVPLTYLLQEKERSELRIVSSYETFTRTFREIMKYITTVEQDLYYNVLQGNSKMQEFLDITEDYIQRIFIIKRKTFPVEDLPAMMQKLKKALFDLYIIQDLIDDRDITDIKITAPDSVRVRIKGRAYQSDITFVDANDYMRFVQALIIRNNIDVDVPEQTFTDTRDPNSILRFTITMPYISANDFPVLHIRKVSRKKMLGDDLIKAGMMDEKIRDYLLDCGRHSTGVIFAGPPGSGKTVLLNWFIEEAYEDSAEILVIQENDELFSYKKGIVFQHVVNNPVGGERRCTLEDLGQLALVAGANVFVIGEAKGGEICSAITLANSGCRTAMTVHSRSSTDTIDKMADLAMRGYATNFEQAKRMLKCFQTIVYLDEFQVREISAVTGYDDKIHDMIYRPIYRADRTKEF